MLNVFCKKPAIITIFFSNGTIGQGSTQTTRKLADGVVTEQSLIISLANRII